MIKKRMANSGRKQSNDENAGSLFYRNGRRNIIKLLLFNLFRATLDKLPLVVPITKEKV
jgi:hypothetical protein